MQVYLYAYKYDPLSCITCLFCILAIVSGNNNPVNSLSSTAGLAIGLTTAVFVALALPFVVVGGVACVVWMKKSRRPLITWDQL